jgi:hypothetical protein
MTALFDCHYNRFKEAGEKLSKHIDAEEFLRWDAIREAARTAIALETGIIDTIPHDGRLKGAALRATQLLIRRYETSEIAA